MIPQTENPEQLILGIAHSLDVATLEPFVLSLGLSGYRGRTCIFVGRKDQKAREFLVSRGIEVEDFDAARDAMLALARFLRLPHQVTRLLEFLALRALQPLATREGTRDLYARLAPLDRTALRFLLYRSFLAGPKGAACARSTSSMFAICFSSAIPSTSPCQSRDWSASSRSRA